MKHNIGERQKAGTVVISHLLSCQSPSISMSIYVYYVRVCVCVCFKFTESACIPPCLVQYVCTCLSITQWCPHLAQYISTLQLHSLMCSCHRFMCELRSGGCTVACMSGWNPTLQQSQKVVILLTEIVGRSSAGLHMKEPAMSPECRARLVCVQARPCAQPHLRLSSLLSPLALPQ